MPFPDWYYSIMTKRHRLIFPALLLIFIALFPLGIRAETVNASPALSSPYDLIDAINTVRAANGLSTLAPNSILMTIAQAQSDYQASIGTYTHLDAYGRRPFQRALDAGYSVAGNITTANGWFGEIVFNGTSVDEAIQWWMNSTEHRNVILSSMYQDIGAGVTSSGDYYYFTVDCGLSTGATSNSSGSSSSGSSSGSQATTTWIPSTPNPDGSIIHIVQPGDTTLAIAIAYGINWSDLLRINNLTDKSIIFPGDEIIISPAFTPTPTQPTLTPTPRDTITPWPTATPGELPTLTPSPTRASNMPLSAAGEAVGAIIVTALILAALFTLIGRKPKGQ